MIFYILFRSMTLRNIQPAIIFFILFFLPFLCHGVPTELGPRIPVASGSDPDIAVDSEQALHIVYVRGANTYYRSVDFPYDTSQFSPELYVGYGTNPQVAIDSNNTPHVVFGRAKYAMLNNGVFEEKEQAFSGWRKNLIAIDSKDRVYIIGDRNSPRDVLVRVYQNGVPLHKPEVVGDDDPGGVGVDTEDTLHVSWRNGNTYYNTYRFDTGKGPSKRFTKSSGDFSWCSVDPKTGAIHVVYTAAYARGLHHIALRNGQWTEDLHFGYNEVIQREPDDVNPVSANDALGNTYITFRGRNAVGYFVVLDENDQIMGGFNFIDPEFNSYPGGKMTNPNIATYPTFNGAYVAWGKGQVYVRSIGDIANPSTQTVVSATMMDILLNKE